MQTGFPLVMLIGPLVAAVIALIARSRRRVSVAVGLVAVGLLTLLLALAAPAEGLFADNTLTFFGRDVVMTPFVRSLFLFIYPAMGALFAVSWFRPGGRALIPLGLAVLSPLAAALMVTPAGLGVVPIVAAAAVILPALHGGRYEAASAAWRYFLMTAIALAPLLLITSSPFEAGAATWIIPLIATLTLLGGFPFHIWVGTLGRLSPPAAVTLTLGLAQIVVVVFLLGLLGADPATRASAEFQSAVGWSAVLTALIAAFQMGRAADWRGVIAGAILLDMGFLLAATLAPGVDGLIIALPALISRYLSLLLITLGLWRPQVDETQQPAISFQWRSILPLLLLVYGCLSLIGLPLTPGFAGRWAQIAVIGRGGGAPAGLLVVAMGAATFTLARAALHARGQQGARMAAGSRGEVILSLILFGLAVLLGLFPDLLPRYAAGMLGM